VDCSPGGSATAAVMAVLDAMGLLGDAVSFTHEGLSGAHLTGRVSSRTMVEDRPALVVDLDAKGAWPTGEETWIPFTDDAVVSWGMPDAGDVVIVKSPADGVDIVKRVIGVPGDRIEIRDDVVFRNGGIEGTLVVHVIDAAHELGITPPERLLDNDVAERTREQLGAILKPRLTLRSDDRRLDLQWISLEVLRDDAALRLKYRIANEQPGALTVLTRLFPYDPLHQTFVNIYEDGG
jgi:hypothetical protein